MTVNNVPWFVSQEGVEHDSAVARSVAYLATQGKSGIANPGDMKVSAMSTPTGKVRVARGVAAIPSRYTGANGQSYVGVVDSQTEVTINPTSSTGGRNDLVVLRIQDTAFEGSQPADVNNFSYCRLEVIQGVPASTNSVTDLGLTYPAIALGLIKIPASTSAITSSMISDLRNLANPRTQDVWFPLPTVASQTEVLTATRENGESFINAANQDIQVPDWAVRMQLRVEWLGVRIAPGNAYGQMWAEWGEGVGGLNGTQDRAQVSQKYQWDTGALNNIYRTNWIVVDDMYVPAKYRGTTQRFVQKARRAGGTANTVSLDGLSGMSVQIRFLETKDDNLLEG